VEYFQRYYDDLTKRELAHDDYLLIVIIEAAWYCKTSGVDCIRYNQLKERSNNTLNRITDGERSALGGGSFPSIIYSRRCKRFLRIVKIEGKKETQIYPNIPLIEKEVKRRQAENFNDKVLRHAYKSDPFPRTRSITEPSVAISESLTGQRSKTRSQTESVSISEGLGMTVTHANPKKAREK
jgi:hypothetical protein